MAKALAARWQAGSLITSDRFACHYSKKLGAICQTCQEVDSLQHVLWKCPRWAKWRCWDLCTDSACLRVSGIVPAGEKHDLKSVMQYALGAIKIYQQYHKWQESGYDA
eukprot:4763926-Amphidinium_carterae.1